MNKNYTPAYVSCPMLPLRACHWLHFVSCANRHLFRSWRFCLFCVIGALLVSAAVAPAATITVMNGNDHGRGSLRQAIHDASPGDTINFSPGVTTVNLTTDELVIDKNLTIIGPRDNHLTVRRNTQSLVFRIFHITSSTAVVSIFRLRMSSGIAGDDFEALGALVVLVAIQLSVLGLYLPPVLKSGPLPYPPQRAQVWDQDSPLAKSGDASKRLQLLVDKTHARQSLTLGVDSKSSRLCHRC